MSSDDNSRPSHGLAETSELPSGELTRRNEDNHDDATAPYVDREALNLALSEYCATEAEVTLDQELLGGEREEAAKRVRARHVAKTLLDRFERIVVFRSELQRKAHEHRQRVNEPPEASRRVLNEWGWGEDAIDGWHTMMRSYAKGYFAELDRFDADLVKCLGGSRLLERVDKLTNQWGGLALKNVKPNVLQPQDRKRAIVVVAYHAVLPVLKALHSDPKVYAARDFEAALLRCLGGADELDHAAWWLRHLQRETMASPPEPERVPLSEGATDEPGPLLHDRDNAAAQYRALSGSFAPSPDAFELARQKVEKERNDRRWERQQLLRAVQDEDEGTDERPGVRRILLSHYNIRGPKDAARHLLERMTKGVEPKAGDGVSASTVRDYLDEGDLDSAMRLLAGMPE